MKSPYVSRVPISLAETTNVLLIAILLSVLFLVLEHVLPTPFARHMLQHIATMNILAPAVAWMLTARTAREISVRVLIASSALQLALLSLWHMPSVFPQVHESVGLAIAMHVSLLASAVMFWFSVLSLSRHRPWWSIAALLVTGKLYCLYGVLLIFASRQLFGHAVHAHHSVTQADQQLAGLIMVTACPLTYVAAAVALVVKWMNTWEGASGVDVP